MEPRDPLEIAECSLGNGFLWRLLTRREGSSGRVGPARSGATQWASEYQESSAGAAPTSG